MNSKSKSPVILNPKFKKWHNNLNMQSLKEAKHKNIPNNYCRTPPVNTDSTSRVAYSTTSLMITSNGLWLVLKRMWRREFVRRNCFTDWTWRTNNRSTVTLTTFRTSFCWWSYRTSKSLLDTQSQLLYQKQLSLSINKGTCLESWIERCSEWRKRQEHSGTCKDSMRSQSFMMRLTLFGDTVIFELDPTQLNFTPTMLKLSHSMRNLIMRILALRIFCKTVTDKSL